MGGAQAVDAKEGDLVVLCCLYTPSAGDDEQLLPIGRRKWHLYEIMYARLVCIKVL